MSKAPDNPALWLWLQLAASVQFLPWSRLRTRTGTVAPSPNTRENLADRHLPGLHAPRSEAVACREGHSSSSGLDIASRNSTGVWTPCAPPHTHTQRKSLAWGKALLQPSGPLGDGNTLQWVELVLGWPRRLPGKAGRGVRGGRRLLCAKAARSELLPAAPPGRVDQHAHSSRKAGGRLPKNQRQRELDPAALNTAPGAFIKKKAIYFTV